MRFRNRRLKRTLAIVLQCATAVLAVVAVISAVSLWPGRSSRNTADVRFKAAATDSKARRPVYPYSVIRGGAYSPSELKDKLASDKVAARHYEAFDLVRVRVIKADSPRPVYVSYRKGESIYWTRRPVQLHKDEPLLTDGVFFARARCGNRVSDSPQKPVAETAAAEPSPNILDVPERWEPEAPLTPDVASGTQILPALVATNASKSKGSRGSALGASTSYVSRSPELWVPGLGVPIVGGASSIGETPSIAPWPDPGLPAPPDAGSGQGMDSYPITKPFPPHPQGPGRGPYTGRPNGSPPLVTPPAQNPPDQTPPAQIPPDRTPPDQDPPPLTPPDDPPTYGPGPLPPPSQGPPDQSPPGQTPPDPPKNVPPHDPGSPPEDPGPPPRDNPPPPPINPDVPVAPLPEPSTFVLFGTVLLFAGLFGWRYYSSGKRSIR